MIRLKPKISMQGNATCRARSWLEMEFCGLAVALAMFSPMNRAHSVPRTLPRENAQSYPTARRHLNSGEKTPSQRRDEHRVPRAITAKWLKVKQFSGEAVRSKSASDILSPDRLLRGVRISSGFVFELSFTNKRSAKRETRLSAMTGTEMAAECAARHQRSSDLLAVNELPKSSYIVNSRTAGFNT